MNEAPRVGVIGGASLVGRHQFGVAQQRDRDPGIVWRHERDPVAEALARSGGVQPADETAQPDQNLVVFEVGGAAGAPRRQRITLQLAPGCRQACVIAGCGATLI